MGLVKRADSPFWWVNLERPGLPPIRESTKILVKGATPFQTQQNKQLAQQVYAIRMADLAQGRHKLTAREDITFRAFAEWYGAHVTPNKRSADTERSVIRVLVRHLGDYSLQQLDRATVLQYFVTPRKRVAKASTINRDMDVLKDMLAKAVPRFLEASPLHGMKRLRQKGLAVRAISREEEARLLKHADRELAAFVTLGITTLMRLKDLVYLRWDYVHATYVDVIDPKVKPYKAPLSKRALKALEVLDREGPWVFTSFHEGKGATAPENRAIRAFAALCKTAKVPHGRKSGGVTVHAMRHTGATRALAAGHSIRAVQELGGWTDIRSVMRYSHPQDRELRAAVESL